MSDYMASELIRDLQDIVEKHGDLPVLVVAYHGCDPYEYPVNKSMTEVRNEEKLFGHLEPRRITIDCGL